MWQFGVRLLQTNGGAAIGPGAPGNKRRCGAGGPFLGKRFDGDSRYVFRHDQYDIVQGERRGRSEGCSKQGRGEK